MKKPRLYLDLCCFNRPFDDQTQFLVWMETQAILLIQEGIKSGEFELAWSYILNFENGKNPDEQKRNAVFNWRNLATTMIRESERIVKTAVELRKDGVKLYDSIHVACAIAAECDCFISTDKRLLKKRISGIKLCNPLDFIQLKEPEK